MQHAHGNGPGCATQKWSNFKDLILNISEVDEEIKDGFSFTHGVYVMAKILKITFDL